MDIACLKVFEFYLSLKGFEKLIAQWVSLTFLGEYCFVSLFLKIWCTHIYLTARIFCSNLSLINLYYSKDECTKTYKIGEEVGRGSFAIVKRAQHLKEKTEWAVKVFDKVSTNYEISFYMIQKKESLTKHLITLLFSYLYIEISRWWRWSLITSRSFNLKVLETSTHCWASWSLWH